MMANSKQPSSREYQVQFTEKLVAKLHQRSLQPKLLDMNEESGSVPFAKLSKEEQSQRLADGAALLDTIRELGYQLVPVEGSELASQGVTNTENLGLSQLCDLVGRLKKDVPVESRCAIAQRALDLGEALLAYEVLSGCSDSEDLRCRQLLGLALARSGDTKEAQEVLQRLYDQGHRDAETRGLLARTYKDLWKRGGSIEPAIFHYLQAFQDATSHGSVSDQIYTGINAATSLLWGGRTEEAQELAQTVKSLCGEEKDYWSEATLGEVALVCGDLALARKHFSSAAEKAPGRYGQQGSTRNQARLLLRHLGLDTSSVDDCFSIPDVFAVRCVEEPEAPKASVAAALKELDSGPALAYLYLAGKNSLVLLEVMLEQGWTVHVVVDVKLETLLPELGLCPKKVDSLLCGVSSVTIANPQGLPQDTSSASYSHLLQLGLARLRADSLGSRTRVVSWKDGSLVEPRVEKYRQEELPSTNGRAVRALLFADVANFSKLQEHQIPFFMERYMGEVAAHLQECANQPLLKNTWGDALYFVFSDIEEGGRFALQLRDRLLRVNWEDHGLPGSLRIRIGLHAGPVFSLLNPVTGRENFTGSHVSWAARIEPVTPPGEVYVSQPFAAALAAHEDRSLHCSYVGQTRLAKDMGRFATYHLRQA